MSAVPALTAAARRRKARRRCPYCGNHLEIFTRYCNECGHEVPRPSKRAIYLLATLVAITAFSVFIIIQFI